jgi:hypothetical protein
MDHSAAQKIESSHPADGAKVPVKEIIQLFEQNFLGTQISSFDRPGSRDFQVCQCCFDMGRPQGDCCPLY